MVDSVVESTRRKFRARIDDGESYEAYGSTLALVKRWISKGRVSDAIRLLTLTALDQLDYGRWRFFLNTKIRNNSFASSLFC